MSTKKRTQIYESHFESRKPTLMMTTSTAATTVIRMEQASNSDSDPPNFDVVSCTARKKKEIAFDFDFIANSQKQQGHVLSKLHPNGCLEVTLNRPEALNALSMEMLEKLNSLLRSGSKDARIKLVVLNSSSPSKAFSAGGDIKKIISETVAWNARWHHNLFNLARRIFRYEKPVIALINGVCMGGGVCEIPLPLFPAPSSIPRARKQFDLSYYFRSALPYIPSIGLAVPILRLRCPRLESGCSPTLGHRFF